MYSHLLNENDILWISGRVSIREDEPPKLIAEDIEPIEAALKKGAAGLKRNFEKDGAASGARGAKGAPTAKRLYIKLPAKTRGNLIKVEERLAPYQDGTEVRLLFEDTRKQAAVPRRLWFNGAPSAVEDLKSIFGEDNVRMK